MSKRQLIEVFYGDAVAHESERRAIGALRAELEQRQIQARLLVNFTVSLGVRQIELIIGTENGPWQQVQPDGSHRPMDKNYYTQARDQTYGLNDAMHELAKAGRVP